MPHPIMLFKKPLKPTDITKRLAIRTKSLESLPHFNGGHAVRLKVLYEGRGWPMVCSTRKQGHKKPVLSNGWIPFVRENHLKVGDVVTLYKEGDEAGLQYRIEVDRATRVPSPNGNLGVQTPYKTKKKTGFKLVDKALFNSSKKINLGLVSGPREIVLNLDLTLAPPGKLPS
ncbi:hypothetical protein SLEP1_g40833 [Rubroshorea leprosula]|uniref:TF-B3 domain-containing protein n=1 Tax=Rubroshorea leprosula TaxID=152421 RepID=A0AAV5L5J4_9ROSI|nr:hypothetical protein SLEP1_g40833 [Rubroshorea leprosula]